MSPFVRSSKRGPVLGLTLGLTTALSLVAIAPLAGPAQALPDGCDQAFPVAELAKGRTVNGLTVDSGTDPEPFTGEVLGVLEDGIAPGLDMIMMRLESEAIADAGGIWQGMSGSPVYDDATGDLIGAVAYGMAWGSSPVAGITPFEDMDDYIDAAIAEEVDVPRASARTIARKTALTVTQAEQGFERLPVPMGISGVSGKRLSQDFEREAPYLGQRTFRTTGAASEAAAGVDTIVPGGNLAAVESTGDVTSAGVGTVTSVCDDHVVGFGHPMAFSGETSLGLGAADAIYVQEDPVGVPFKLANIGEIGGTISEDRLAGISGELGPVPSAVPFRSTVTYGDRTRTGDTDVFVEDALAAISFYAQLGNHDRVVDAIGDGTSRQDWTVTGTDEHGQPFTIDAGDVYTSEYDLSYEASYQLADILWALTRLPGVEVTGAEATSTVTDETDTYRIRKVEQKVGDRFVNVTKKRARVAAGGRLVLRVTVASGTGTATVPFAVRIPARLEGKRGSVRLEGGNWDWVDIYDVDNVQDLVDTLAAAPQNNQVAADVEIGRGGKKLDERMLSAPLDLVVDRSRYVTVVVGKAGRR